MTGPDVTGDSQRIPVIQEEASVTKRVIETERVNVNTSYAQETVVVRDTVVRDYIDVRRVAIGREVDEAPPIREEGDVTVVPVLEERLVIEKRLFLVEEVHLIRRRETEDVAIPTDVRRTIVTVDRATPEQE